MYSINRRRRIHTEFSPNCQNISCACPSRQKAASVLCCAFTFRTIGAFGIAMTILSTARGRCLPVGASSQVDGVNFVVPCRHGTKVWLVLYSVDAGEPIAELELDGLKNRTGDHWHIFVSGLPPVFRYGWRIDGPPGTGTGSTRVPCSSIRRLQPFPAAISGALRESRKRNDRFAQHVFRRWFNWREDVPPRNPIEDSVIYELHVRGFTQHPVPALLIREPSRG